MAIYHDREHYIPLRRTELVRLLCAQLSSDEATVFRTFCDRLSDRVHLEFHRLLERMKEDYAPFDPDADTQSLEANDHSNKPTHAARLFDEIDRLLTRANYTVLTRDQILACQKGASYWGLDMSIDLDAFSYIALCVRGKGIGQRSLRSWRTWFRQKTFDVEIFRRLVIVLQQKKHWRLGKSPDTRSIFLKFFKDIPTADLEMIIPGARLQMPKFERGKLGFSIISGLLIIAYQLLAPIFWAAKVAVGGIAFGPFGIFAALFGYGYRQYYGYQFSLKHYNLKLAQSLYYQNLDNNCGVLFRLLDSAEEQECRETILAYFALLQRAGRDGMSAEQLDDAVEELLGKFAGVKVDFEIDDALRKVEAIGLARNENGRYRPISIADALARLDAMPSTAIFTQEMTRDESLDLGTGPGNRDVGSSEDLRARPEPQSAS